MNKNFLLSSEVYMSRIARGTKSILIRKEYSTWILACCTRVPGTTEKGISDEQPLVLYIIYITVRI